MMPLRSVCRTVSSIVLLALVTPAFAADAGSDAAKPERRGALFPPFKKRSEKPAPEAAAPAADVAPGVATEPITGEGPAPDAPAEDEPTDGVLEWVDRMEGEIPTREQVAAVKEHSDVQSSERVLVDDLTGNPPPLALYADPGAALAVDPLYLDLVDPSEFDIPIETNAMVAKWVRYFTGDGREHYQRWLGRSTRVQPMMRAKLAEKGLPQDLVYLSMIESGYNTHAYSSADAAGLWQFIPSTGKLYDLRIDYWVDERRDPEAAVEAATTFLSELHTMFGDWRLAWASYNGGPGRVRRATDKAGTKDFWTLASGTFLHPETENYVPKIMAAAIIGHHPERYGFTDITFQSELTYETQRVDGSVEFDVLARCAGTTVDNLKDLNPALRRLATPPEGYDLRIPVGSRDTFVSALASVPKEERVATVQRHTVRRGETLSTIATKYHTTVSTLSRANNLKNINHIYVGMNLVIPRAGGTTSAGVADAEPRSSSSSSSTARASAPKTATVHTVVRGDTLSGVADRYHVTMAQVKEWNNLSSSTIQLGEKLKVSPGTAGSTSTASSSSASGSSATRSHTVARGETLASIARRYGMEASALQKLNGIRDASHIEVGQKLKVSGSAGGSTASNQWTTVTVQRGESLGLIAERNNCSVTELKSWNGLSNSVIQPGQKLKVKRG